MKRCPRCSAELSVNDKACPKCGLLVSQMEEIQKRFNLSSNDDNTESDSEKLTEKDLLKKQKEEKKQAKKAKKEEKKKKKEIEELDFSKLAENSEESESEIIYDTDTYAERRKKRKKKQAKPKFLIDENGEFNINTDDVEIVGEETAREVSKQYEQSYSIKKSRGDYIPPKIKWWEIYKIADRHFARSKIKKEVNKAARIKPNYVKKSTLILLSIFLGWTGAHNFYAKNKRKGWLSVFLLVIWVGVVSLSWRSAFFAKISISVGGGAGFFCLFIWISDLINIIMNKFKYKFQRDRFIAGLNVTTRAKLGKKYIDMDLYHKPLWYRFKVWCGELKKNSEIRKRERRQASIEREKRRIEEQEEKNRINREIAEFEEKENRNLSKKDFVDERTLEELKSFESEEDNDNFESETSYDNDETEENSEDTSNEEIENNDSDVDNTNENLTAETEEAESDNLSSDSATKKVSSAPRKYAKTVKNKKAEQRKKKK